MIDSCLSFDQLFDFISCIRLTDENKTKMSEINIHLINCIDCNEKYNLLNTLYQEINDWTLLHQIEISQEIERLRFCLSLKRASKHSAPGLVKKINKWLRNFVLCSVKIKLDVLENVNMIIDNLSDLVVEPKIYNLSYAQINLTRGGSSSEGEHNVIVDINNAFNQIKIDNDKTLSIQLDLPNKNIPPLIALVPSDIDQAAMLFELSYNEDNQLWELTTGYLDNGKYELLIENI